jgi:futalosine hydrolase
VERPLALICSVALEAEPLLARLEAAEALSAGGKPAWHGRLHDHPVVVLAGGMGKTNAAHALTALAERTRLAAVIGFGVAGAYLRAGLATGAVALASAEIYADEGVETPEGWLDCRGIGIPLVERDGEPLFNRFAADPILLAAARAATGAPAGPFLSVSTCSGTSARGDALAARFAAICETMEGAAYAHVAALYDLPYLGVRGISNQVEDRDLSRWRLGEAASAAADAVCAVVRAAQSTRTASC